MSDRSALEVAMDIFHRPIAVRDYLNAPLPRDVLTVIRIAAGAEIETSNFGLDQTRRARDMREACGFYVQQILFHAKADPYRLLGLAPGADPKQVQDHKRMLLKWLHPDRNPNKWEQALFQRVIKAAEYIENNSVELIPLIQRSRKNRPGSGQVRPFHGMPLQRVPVKGYWRRKLYRYFKRGILGLSLAMGIIGATIGINGGDPFDFAMWQDLVGVAWLK